MRRSLFIAMAVAGVMLVVAAALVAAVAFVPPGDQTAVSVAEAVAGIAGLVMAYAGLMLARDAAEFHVALHGRRRPGRRAAAVAVADPEVAFACPECGRSYRAAGQMAGRPFACRACDARFTVPRPAAG